MKGIERRVDRGDSSVESDDKKWAEFIASCKKMPLAPWQEIDSKVSKLNSISEETECTFYLSHVTEGATGPTIVPQAIPVHGGEFGLVSQVDSVGPVIRQVLDQLPASVRTGADSQYQFWQVRLDEVGVIENAAGTTALLMVLLRDLHTGDCYFLPDHEDSKGNWKVLTEMYVENFPMSSDTE